MWNPEKTWRLFEIKRNAVHPQLWSIFSTLWSSLCTVIRDFRNVTWMWNTEKHGTLIKLKGNAVQPQLCLNPWAVTTVRTSWLTAPYTSLNVRLLAGHSTEQLNETGTHFAAFMCHQKAGESTCSAPWPCSSGSSFWSGSEFCWAPPLTAEPSCAHAAAQAGA